MIRTGYSFGAAVGDIDEVLDRIKEMGWTHAPIADRNSTFGYSKWTAGCKARGLTPVYGVEIGVSSDRYAKKPDIDYFVFLAKDNIKAINKLVALATDQTNHEPLLSYEQAMNAEGVYILTGANPRISEITKPHSGSALLSIMPSTPAAIINHFCTGSRPMFDDFVVRPDNQFCNPGDDVLYHTVCDRWSRSRTTPQYIADSGQLYTCLADKLYDHDFATWLVENGEQTRQMILDDCDAKLGAAELYKPKTPFNLREECIRGSVDRRVDLGSGLYADRLERELAVIEGKSFTDYFQIISDVVSWARSRMFVGPARGSSCGSLVCYLLGITSIDPIEHDLVFERFIDENRSDLPDIDIDFSDQQRGQVFDYIKETYGAGHVARLGTVAVFRARSALAIVAKALSIPSWRTDALADIIEPKALGAEDRDLSIEQALVGTDIGRKLAADFPEIRIATRIQGQPRHFSQHAAGVILTEEPIDTYVAVDSRTGATQCDKYDAEKLNLLKVDILGLIQLSVLEDCLEMTGRSRKSLEEWPIDDPGAYRLLDEGQFSGIFQFNGRALQSIADQIDITCFEDIVSITALARPGPLHSGMTQDWIMRKNGLREIPALHPMIDGILAPTLGVITYQEQIMQICRDVGGMEWSDVNKVRRGMGKSMGADYFAPFRDAFLSGAVSSGLDREKAIVVWDAMVEFGAYAFNKSHSVAYAMISYWCAVMKAHHPMEFYAATLSHTDDQDKKIVLLRDADAQGIGYVPFDRDLSTSKWTIGSFDGVPKLVGPVSGIIGIGPVAANEILSERTKPWERTSARTQKLLASGKTDVDTIYPIRDRVKQLYPDGVPGVVTKVSSIREVLDPNYSGSPVIMGVVAGIKEKDGKYGKELNLFVKDDTGEMFVKVYTSHFDTIAKDIIARGGKGKMIYALKGNVRDGEFRMMTVTKHRFVGDTGK
ncbi:MAG: DNA polymerase III subunit alpha [Desulfurellales bacterium]|nr:MAG: DNA polymerase III subunit alpha [Desulfurellales bacterium]